MKRLTCAALLFLATLAQGQSWTTGTIIYDGSGNIRSMGANPEVPTEPADRFVYDVNGRLVQGTADQERTGGQNRQDYTYDRFGNQLTRQTTGAACVGGCADMTLTIAATTNHITSPAATYDAAGNLLTFDGSTYSYDGAGMLSRQIGPNNSIDWRYIYTADDERIATYTGSDNWRFTVRDLDGKVLRELTASKSEGTTAWTWDRDHVYRQGGLLLATVSPSGRQQFHLDHLGTPRLVTNATGVQIGVHSYYPFGEELSLAPTESPAGRLKYTGHERDESGLAPAADYMHARYYRAGVGRFLSVDPTWESVGLAKPQSWNRYSYVLNNPINYTDPDGRQCSAAVADYIVTGGRVGGVKGAVIGGVVGVVIVVGHIEVGGKSIGRHVGDFMLSGGGSSGEMAAETMVRNYAAKQAEEAEPAELPARDSTGKVHGELPTPADLREHSTEDLKQFQEELKGSVGRRIDVTNQLGPDKAHGERQAAEQRLIKQIDKIIKDREPKQQ